MSDLPSFDVSDVDLANIPTHVGVIMDGNGRWAKARGLERTQGHTAGEVAIFRAVDGALAMGLPWMTLYTFSTENWSRSEEEVAFLMLFNESIIVRRRDELNEKGVRVHFTGQLDDLRIPDRNRELMAETSEMTAGNTNLNLVFAFNHGGRSDLVEAARRVARRVEAGAMTADEVDEAAVGAAMPMPEMPDCDLVIRTSGEQRISNFLLWQVAYAELLFPEILWPDFTGQDLIDLVVDFQRRERRFGAAR